jgi:hypothetical protein
MWTFRNEGLEAVVVVFEPWADEIRVEPGSVLVIEVHGGTRPRDGEPPLEVIVNDPARVTVWAQWPGGTGSASLDGTEL